ncbi:MAG: PQQ-like beta-propeller repeat protein [Planctomycetales bacterium]|nr:PQQ-like beta-propeller repeat protein [Planctomycetales bacterium]MCA9222055.1 PQQ-like beta-propeller repeat protein [Planctomycetales bacterium]MCB9920601.1 PQQ-like beta-propeller repeat protein [Planctomycetaceae bacterium]
MHIRIYVLLAALTIGIHGTHTAEAEDWPQWMGPGRNNVWAESGVLERFPEGGPKVLWRTPIAGGYSGPAVADGRVYITDYATSDDVKVANFERKNFAGGVERVLCLDERSGEILWKHEYPVEYSVSYPAGPRCTTTVDGDNVYTLGAEGNLICFVGKTGEVKWSKNLPATYNTKTALWGYAAHPLVDGNRLITLAGGDGTHTVALDKETGEEIWRSGTASEQGYSPPTIIEYAGVRQLILLSPDHVRSVNPMTGVEYWSVPYEASNGSIIMSPVLCGEYLYVAGFSQRSLLLKLTSEKSGVTEVWRDKRKDAISPVNVQPFFEDGVLYGFDQSGDLAAVAIPSGERLWETPQPLAERRLGSGTAFIVKQADRFWMFTEHGELVIAEMDKDGFRELDRTKVIEPSNVAFGRDVVWSMPAFANKHAYIRNDSEIICVDLAE